MAQQKRRRKKSNGAGQRCNGSLDGCEGGTTSEASQLPVARFLLAFPLMNVPTPSSAKM